MCDCSSSRPVVAEGGHGAVFLYFGSQEAEGEVQGGGRQEGGNDGSCDVRSAWANESNQAVAST